MSKASKTDWKRLEAMQRFTKVAKLNREVVALGKKLDSTPQRHLRVRAGIESKLVRSRVRLAHALGRGKQRAQRFIRHFQH